MKTKKNIISICLLAFVITGSYAQEPSALSPYSFSHTITSVIPTITTATPDFSKDIIAAKENEKNGNYPVIAKHFNINVTSQNAGVWTTLENGDRIWQLRIKSGGAISTCVFFDNFFIPQGAILSEYSPDRSQVFSYTVDDNQGNFLFSGEFIKGDEHIIEYYEPANVRGQGAMHITDVAHQFRDLEAGPCHVNVVCTPEGTGWQEKKKGICRIYIVTSAGGGYCSGTLVNNTALNCKRYILTAYHCGGGATTTQLSQWKFYFNYEATQCTGQGDTYGNTTNSFTGCSQRAGGNLTGGSDFLLLEMTSTSTPTWWAYTAYFNGWTNATSSYAGSTCIHHPAGNNKKISIATSIPFTNTYPGCAANAHWQTTFVATANGHSVPEGGSSGSPLFNGAGLVMGTLTGGATSCTLLTGPELYGKMSYHWISNGTTNATRLKPWLDPNNSGVTTLNGNFSPCNVGIDDQKEENSFTIYPNPSKGEFTINIELAKQENIQIRVFNIVGQEIFTKKIADTQVGKFTIDLSSQSNGIYFVELKTNEQVSSKKISLVK